VLSWAEIILVLFWAEILNHSVSSCYVMGHGSVRIDAMQMA